MLALSLLILSLLASTVVAKVTLPSKFSLPKKSSSEPKSSLEKTLAIRGGGGGDIGSLDWRYFLAGGICAAASHGYTTPIGEN